MADFDLNQTGQEVQGILDGAAMQTDLIAETERAELAEQTLQGGIDAEETRAKAAEKQNADDIDLIEAKIPAGASSENQLADKQYVNNAVATASATYRGAYNEVSDLSLTVDATHEQIATALAGAIDTADNNDYAFVQIPTSTATPTEIAAIERYKFNGTAWSYEYTLNNSGFTADQWAALNSGITSGLVAKLIALPTNEALTLALAGKQDALTFDNVPVSGSNNPVKSGGIYSAINDEATRAKAAEKANADDIDGIEAMIPTAASDENQLADKQYVNDGIATATATYRGSYNEVSDLSLTIDATHSQIAAALAVAISTADNNDYAFVQIPTSDATPTQIASIERYKFNGTAWSYEYTLNNSGFTADQWAALNSGITSGLVAKLSALPTNDALTQALAGKQDVLTFDNVPTSDSNNPVKSGGVHSAIDAEATTRAAAIAAIVALIPQAASALNQLADKAFVNSSISTATAVFKGTFNVVVDLELSYNASQQQIVLMLASKIISADNNDYCFVQIPTSNETPLEIARTDRYKFNGTAWAYEYTLNNSGFTASQWAAINSGITSLLKDKLIDLPTATELTTLLAAKQNQLTFDTTPTTGSTNPVTSDGIKSAIDAEKARAEAAEGALDSEKADKATTLAGYGITDAYTKTEVNRLVSTPHQNYVTVPTYASLPSSGQSTDTIYRVSSYDGVNSQVDNTVYSEYAWDGTQYVFLDVKSQIEEVFDITEYNSGTKYADLSAALGVDGANIPATLRRGGMSIKYVQSSDNKYVQYRLMSNSFNTTPANWQGVDDVPTAGSDNLVKSGGVKEANRLIQLENNGFSISFSNKAYSNIYFGVDIPSGTLVDISGDYKGNGLYLIHSDGSGNVFIGASNFPYTTEFLAKGFIPINNNSGVFSVNGALSNLPSEVNKNANAITGLKEDILPLTGYSLEFENKSYIPIYFDGLVIPAGTLIKKTAIQLYYKGSNGEQQLEGPTSNSWIATFDVTNIIPTTNDYGKVWVEASVAHSSDSYTKAETNELLNSKADEDNVSGEVSAINSQISSINNTLSSLVESATPLSQINKVVNAADFGFEPSATPETNTSALNTALYGGNKTVIVSKAGIYNLNNTIYLYDNTTLIFTKGVILKKYSNYSHVFINIGAESRTINKNISLIGINLDVNAKEQAPGIESPLFGMKGQVSFLCSDRVLIKDFTCTTLGSNQYAIQFNTFHNIAIQNPVIEGAKDGIHLSDGDMFRISDCIINTADDPIALNASDWVSSNCVDGSITNGIIENIQTNSYNNNSGHFRLLVGAWIDWYSGMKIKRGDRVVSNGNVYRACINTTDGTEYTSETEPTITSFTGTQHDAGGFEWKLMKIGAYYKTDISNITYKNCVCLGDSNYFNCEVDTNGNWNRSLYPEVTLANYPLIEKIKAGNCKMMGAGGSFYSTPYSNILFYFKESYARIYPYLESPIDAALLAEYHFDNMDFRHQSSSIQCFANTVVYINNCTSYSNNIHIGGDWSGRIISNVSIDKTPGGPLKGDYCIINNVPSIYNGTNWVELI